MKHRTTWGALAASALLVVACSDKSADSIENEKAAEAAGAATETYPAQSPRDTRAIEPENTSRSANPAGIPEQDIRGLRAALEPAKRDIPLFCEGEPECVDTQKEQLGLFLNMMLAFEDPGQQTAKRCMLAGKGSRYIDWQKAADCMREHVRGRPIGG